MEAFKIDRFTSPLQLKKELKAKASASGKEGTEASEEDKSSKDDSEAISTSGTSSVEKAVLSDKDARLVGMSPKITLFDTPIFCGS